MENPPVFQFGKPSISMGHLYHGYVRNNQRVLVVVDFPDSYAMDVVAVWQLLFLCGKPPACAMHVSQQKGMAQKSFFFFFPHDGI